MEKTKSKKFKGFKVLLILFILGMAVGIGFSYFNKSLGPVSLTDNKDITVEVLAGSSTDIIAKQLYENNLIHNELIFKVKVKELGVGSSLKAGKYTLNKSMDIVEIIETLNKGVKSGNTARFTIPEGYELEQVANKLSNEGIVDYTRFMELSSDKSNFQDKFEFLNELDEGQSLEGFLFPSTYEIFTGSSEKEIIDKMLAEFEKVYESEIKSKLDEFDFTLNEAVTLASIVEREGKLDSERPIMSGVFHNRLDIGMSLQSCATVQYILGERKEVLTTQETQIQSPYNTYINQGLPPGPIASPGKASLVAAVNPADVDYLFFVLTGSDGSHTFTKTYNEHLKAKPNN
ncbi:MAG: endolytic transglycosylase MltG [Tissierellaceae bacterium]|nr:endolytic transglycosylase MltG [Tissierellaceae bacterium]